MANRMALQTEGFDELIRALEKAGQNTKQAAEQALIKGKQAVTPGIQQAIAPHRQTGKTEASLDTTDRVRWVGTTAEVDIGFEFYNGGLPSIFLMYGTPRMAPDKKLYDSVYGAKARQKFEDAAFKELDDLMHKVGG